MSLAIGNLKISVGPAVKVPYLGLLKAYGQIQAQMRADVERLPPAFQNEVYERVSRAYESARNAGLGQQNLVQNLTVLNDVLIQVTEDVSNAYAMLSLFKAKAPIDRQAVGDTFARFSAEAQYQVRAALKQTEGNIGEAVSLVFAGFDPTIDQVKPKATVKVGPAIRTPYLELLKAYGRIQEIMKADVARLSEAFQQEVYARLSVYGGYSPARDPQSGKANLTKNLTALNDILIEVTTDVSIANHVQKGLQEDAQVTFRRFSPTAQAQILAVLDREGDFKTAVALVFQNFDPREAPKEGPVARIIPAPIRDEGRVSLPPPLGQVSLPPPVRVDEPRLMRSLCAALEERRTVDANKLFSQLSKETKSAVYRVLCYYYGTPANDIEQDGLTNWQEDATGLVRPVTIDGRRPIDLLDAALKPAEGMQVVAGNLNQYAVEHGHDACAVISSFAIIEFLRGKLETQEDIDRIIQEGAGAYEESVRRAKELDGMAKMNDEDGKYIPSTSALVIAGFGIAEDLRQRNFVDSGSIETWLGPLKRNAPHIALLTIGNSTMALMYDSKKAQWVYFNSHGDDHKSLDLVTEHTTAVRVVMTEKALIAFLRRKIDAVNPNQVGYIHAMV